MQRAMVKISLVFDMPFSEAENPEAAIGLAKKLPISTLLKQAVKEELNDFNVEVYGAYDDTVTVD